MKIKQANAKQGSARASIKKAATAIRESSRKAHAEKIWAAIRTAPPGKILGSLDKIKTPREERIVTRALVAYEAAPLGGEIDAVTRALERFRNLKASDVIKVTDSLPSPRVGKEVWHWWCVLDRAREQVREAKKEAEEQARRRRVVAMRDQTRRARKAA